VNGCGRLGAGVLCVAAGNGVGCEEYEGACAAQGGSQLSCAHVNHAVLRGVLEVEQAPQILGGVASFGNDFREQTLSVVMVISAFAPDVEGSRDGPLSAIGEQIGDLRAGEHDGGVAQRREDGLSSAQSGPEPFGRDLVQRGMVARPALDLLGEPVKLLSPLRIVFDEVLGANDQ